MIGTAPLIVKKIKCPRHFLLRPGCDPYVMEPIPGMQFLKDADAKLFNVKKWRRKKDARGQWIINRESFYQPEMSAAFIKETVYDSSVPMCQYCRRCINRI